MIGNASLSQGDPSYLKRFVAIIADVSSRNMRLKPSNGSSNLMGFQEQLLRIPILTTAGERGPGNAMIQEWLAMRYKASLGNRPGAKATR